jgi:hypothetical protein
MTVARHRTALLPGGATTTVISSGPFALSRNPLYVGRRAGPPLAIAVVPMDVVDVLT